MLAQCSGSVWFSFVDAVTGFNQISNTRRAMEVLAIVARSGKFLPVCLTFGPVNGPDDFSYVVDRAFGPGRNRKARYTKEWVAYVDDLTVRTGRSIDGKFLTDEEYDSEIKEAMRNAPVEVPQTANDAIEALGIRPKGIGEKKEKHDERVSDHNHPTRQRSWVPVRSRVRYPQMGSFRSVVGCSKPVRFWGLSLLGLYGLGFGCVYPPLLPQPFGSKVTSLLGPSAWGSNCLKGKGAQLQYLERSAGWVRASRPTRGLGPAGQVCVSRLVRGPPAMGKGKGKPSGRRNPQRNWGDLEYLLCQALRHGSSRSGLGWHDLRGRLQENGWVETRVAAEAMQVRDEDIVRVVRNQRKEKIRLEMSQDQEWVRALQGHTPDSGLTSGDFTEGVDLGDEVELGHGTLQERVPSILAQGLIASGGGSREGRLFVHWSTKAPQGDSERTAYSGVRSGSDAMVVARIGLLKEGGIRMYQGKDGVVLTGDVPPELFVRISAFSEGKEGEVLWTSDKGLVPAELPTGDTSSSELEIREISRAEGSSSTLGRGQVPVKQEEVEASAEALDEPAHEDQEMTAERSESLQESREQDDGGPVGGR